MQNSLLCWQCACTQPYDKNTSAPFSNPNKSWAESQNKPITESVKYDITIDKPRPRLLTDTAVLEETGPWVTTHQVYFHTREAI